MDARLSINHRATLQQPLQIQIGPFRASSRSVTASSYQNYDRAIFGLRANLTSITALSCSHHSNAKSDRPVHWTLMKPCSGLSRINRLFCQSNNLRGQDGAKQGQKEQEGGSRKVIGLRCSLCGYDPQSLPPRCPPHSTPPAPVRQSDDTCQTGRHSSSIFKKSDALGAIEFVDLQDAGAKAMVPV